ncbi:MAG: hypothetical protein Q8P31_09525 [Bacillota bacterium]|nr:hypothetical protein [Bacillota bacterium]
MLAGPIIRRLSQLLREITRGFRMYEEVRQQPRGQIIWQRYVTEEAARGMFHLLPCRFPDLGPDLLLKSYIRWGLDKVSQALLPFCAVDPIARNLAHQAADLLFELRQVKSLLPTHSAIKKLLRLHGLPSGFLAEGLEALGWLVDQRGLAGTSETDGIPWVLPMHSLFERWVEHVVRSWARQFGGVVRSARAGETLVPIQWASSYYSSMSSLQPDLVVRAADRVIIFDAKYKGHFMELEQERWQLQGEEMRQEHRHDLHQVLAYAAAYEAEHVVAALVYPMRLPTWQRLAETARTVSTAVINRGGRVLTAALVGLPMEIPRDWAGAPHEWAQLRASVSSFSSST